MLPPCVYAQDYSAQFDGRGRGDGRGGGRGSDLFSNHQNQSQNLNQNQNQQFYAQMEAQHQQLLAMAGTNLLPPHQLRAILAHQQAAATCRMMCTCIHVPVPPPPHYSPFTRHPCMTRCRRKRWPCGSNSSRCGAAISPSAACMAWRAGTPGSGLAR